VPCLGEARVVHPVVEHGRCAGPRPPRGFSRVGRRREPFQEHLLLGPVEPVPPPPSHLHPPIPPRLIIRNFLPQFSGGGGPRLARWRGLSPSTVYGARPPVLSPSPLRGGGRLRQSL